MMSKYLIARELIIIKFIIFVLSAPIKVLDKGLLPLERNSIGMQFFVDLENEHKSSHCILHSRIRECCLTDKKDTDCASTMVNGEYIEFLQPKDRKTFLFFYLTMSQLSQVGYCAVDLKYACGSKQVNQTQELKIPFDTRPKKMTKFLRKTLRVKRIPNCKSADEDPLNECAPVRCDLKYFGTKPFFDNISIKCVEAPVCLGDLNKRLPDIAYDPNSNTCKDLEHPLTIANIYAINSGLGVVMIQSNITNETVRPVVYKLNCSTISQHILFLRDMIYGKLNTEGYSTNLNASSNDAIKSILCYCIGFSILILLLVCCAQAVVWFCSESSKKVINPSKSNLRHRKCEERVSFVNKDVTDQLLREIIVKDLPLDQRGSVIDVCERIGKEIKWQKRYRIVNNKNDVNIRPLNESTDTSTTSDLDNSEKERLLQ